MAHAITNPFSPLATGASIPNPPGSATQKVHAFTRLSGLIGTAGVGAVFLVPTVASDAIAGWITSTGFAGDMQTNGILSANNTPNAGWTTFKIANIPYNSSQFSAGIDEDAAAVSGRIVSYGARVTYTGTELNKSGTIFSYADPNHQNVSGMSVSAVAAKSSAETKAFTRESTTLALFPVCQAELQFPSQEAGNAPSVTQALYPYSGGENEYYATLDNTAATTYLYSAVGNNVGAPIGVIYVTGVSGSTFFLEVDTHLEFIGPSAQAMVTASDVDAHGVSQVMQAAQLLPSIKKSSHKKASPWDHMFTALKHVASKAVRHAVPASEDALGALLA